MSTPELLRLAHRGNRRLYIRSVGQFGHIRSDQRFQVVVEALTPGIQTRRNRVWEHVNDFALVL